MTCGKGMESTDAQETRDNSRRSALVLPDAGTLAGPRTLGWPSAARRLYRQGKDGLSRLWRSWLFCSRRWALGSFHHKSIPSYCRSF